MSLRSITVVLNLTVFNKNVQIKVPTFCWKKKQFSFVKFETRMNATGSIKTPKVLETKH